MNTSKFNINRNNVWEGAVRGVRRSSFCPNNNISVKFSDDSGKIEEAVDLGGPRREFFRLLMSYISKSSLFEGSDSSKNLSLDSRGIRENCYFDTGRFISISLVHGGPSGFFSEMLFKSIAYGPETIQPSLDDVCDFEIASKIKKFADCSTIEELKTLINENLDFLTNAGCLRTVKVLNDKNWLVKDLLMFNVIHRVRGPFESLLKGLETLGILQQIKLHPNLFLPLFCHKPLPLTADVIDNLFQIRFSQKGSNAFLVEQRIVSYWRDFLQDVEERQTSATLGGILVFATGADCVPPLGFEPAPSIEFLHSATNEECLLPLANTCINCLKLPIHSTFCNFKSNMDFAIINTQGFGRQ
ncbi:G2/M phase-specific E3 ubiquitin-protein ligase-like [Spea bombifrons]|uniref:G2/M phase-specific E3 ubiquitin-protein ligase-like n=1 Tax=Spea bombifrons TaxID=233779 RepID=UPI00234BDBCB|nr:G2/M phase-specific E3 ubiquitin-protein ligase-like [Spea bombifrons]